MYPNQSRYLDDPTAQSRSEGRLSMDEGAELFSKLCVCSALALTVSRETEVLFPMVPHPP